MFVDDDAMWCRLHSDAVELERIEVRDSSRGEQDIRNGHPPGAGDLGHDVRALAREPLDAAVREDDLDPLLLERGVQLQRGFGVGTRCDLLSVVDDRHARAEAREDLRELEPDRTCADDE